MRVIDELLTGVNRSCSRDNRCSCIAKTQSVLLSINSTPLPTQLVMVTFGIKSQEVRYAL